MGRWPRNKDLRTLAIEHHITGTSTRVQLQLRVENKRAISSWIALNGNGDIVTLGNDNDKLTRVSFVGAVVQLMARAKVMDIPMPTSGDVEWLTNYMEAEL